MLVAGACVTVLGARADASVVNTMTGAAACQAGGTYTTTYTFTSAFDPPIFQSVFIDTMTVGGAHGDIASYSNPVPPGGEQITVINTPGDFVGTLTLTVNWHTDGPTATGTTVGSVALNGSCPGPPPVNPISGVATCQPDGSYHALFTLQNGVGQSLSIDNIAGGPGFLFSSTNPVPAGGTGQFLLIDIPGSTTGPISMSVGWHWQDAESTTHSGTSSSSVDVDGSCVEVGNLYHPLAPVRILDSRPISQVGPYNSPWTTGTTRTVTIGGAAGVPSNATAVVLNVTVADTSGSSFLTVWPMGGDQPTTSSLNWTAGSVIPNAVTVKLGTSGQVNLFNKTGNADVIIDVAGYYDPNSTGDGFTSLAPVRLLDSRAGSLIGPYSTPWGPGTTRSFNVGGSDGVPSNADAVVFNVTVADTTSSGFLTLYPAGAAKPTASSLNWTPGAVIPNAVTVKLGTSGQVSVFNPAGNADVIIDIAGYYQHGSGKLFYPLTPARLLDSRSGTQVGPLSTPWGPGTSRDITIGGQGGVNAAADSVVLNVTVADTTGSSFLTVWPSGASKPNASSLNWVPGEVIPNAVTVKLGTSGNISAFNHAGNVDVIIDVAGYFS
jgi:hypothetical protein